MNCHDCHEDIHHIGDVVNIERPHGQTYSFHIECFEALAGPEFIPPRNGGEKTYMECKKGGSNKWWEIELGDKGFTTKWGPLPRGAGQSKTTKFPTDKEAGVSAYNLIISKKNKGYKIKSIKRGK